MIRTTLFTLALFVAAGGCSKDESKSKTEPAPAPAEATKPDPTPAPTEAEPPEHGEEGEGGEKDHGVLPDDLQAFHDTFGPIWHTADKAERKKKACAAMDELTEMTNELDVSDAPEGADAEAWRKAAGDLNTSMSDADRMCLEGETDFEKHFSHAHDDFEALTDLVVKK